MKIEAIQLENIRSHIKTTIPFTRGFNCLVGGLGCGKSSVLYSIDFALFGEPVGRSYDYLLREGSDYGKVTVQFFQNGNTYSISRGLRRRGKNIGQDFEALKLFHEEKIIAFQKADAIAEQLKTITGFDRDLWREIIWIRQEHLKELIDAAPRERQRRLDSMFGLSDYEVSWSNIGQHLRDYETEKRILEKDPDVTSKENLAHEYDRATEEYTLLEIEVQDAQENLQLAKKGLEDAETMLKQVEEKKLVIEELRRKEARVHTNVINIEESISSLVGRIEGKKTILNNLQQRLTNIDSQTNLRWKTLTEVGFPKDGKLENLNQLLNDFDEKISNLKAEKEAISRNMLNDKKRLEQLSTENDNQCPLCLQPLNDEYKTAMIQRIKSEDTQSKKTIFELQCRIEKLQNTKKTANEACTNLQAISSKTEDVKNRLTEEQNAFDDLQAELQEKQKSLGILNKQLGDLRFEIERFDMADFEAARNQRERLFKKFYSIESDLRTKENRKKDRLQSLDIIKERIDVAQQKTERIEKITKTVEALSAIRDAYRSIQPKLRSEIVRVLRSFVQQVLDDLVGGEASQLNVSVDDTYTPYIKSESGVDREVSNLSGGERTLLAFAYRLGLGQLIMQSKTGHGLSMLLLDEPTENLGTEDGSISRLGESISRFKAIEQIIAVTHSEDFAEKAGHVIVLEKEAGISKASIAKGDQ
jgi:exonuclease SbcC